MDSLPSKLSGSNPPNTSGVYRITCTANKKFYIGSSVDLRRRKWEHFSHLRHNQHINPHLQNAWNKYGEDAFLFEVLELTLSINTAAREQYWLEKLKPYGKKGFNIARDTDAPLLGRKQSPEAIEKVRQSHIGKKRSPEAIERMRQAARNRPPGRKHTPETIEKLRQINLGKKMSPESIEKMRQKKSPEAIEKMRQAHLGKKLSPEHVEKVRQANLGKKRSSEVIEKLRQKGKNEITNRKRDEKGRLA